MHWGLPPAETCMNREPPSSSSSPKCPLSSSSRFVLGLGRLTFTSSFTFFLLPALLTYIQWFVVIIFCCCCCCCCYYTVVLLLFFLLLLQSLWEEEHEHWKVYHSILWNTTGTVCNQTSLALAPTREAVLEFVQNLPIRKVVNLANYWYELFEREPKLIFLWNQRVNDMGPAFFGDTHYRACITCLELIVQQRRVAINTWIVDNFPCAVLLPGRSHQIFLHCCMIVAIAL